MKGTEQVLNTQKELFEKYNPDFDDLEKFLMTTLFDVCTLCMECLPLV